MKQYGSEETPRFLLHLSERVQTLQREDLSTGCTHTRQKKSLRGAERPLLNLGRSKGRVWHPRVLIQQKYPPHLDVSHQLLFFSQNGFLPHQEENPPWLLLKTRTSTGGNEDGLAPSQPPPQEPPTRRWLVSSQPSAGASLGGKPLKRASSHLLFLQSQTPRQPPACSVPRALLLAS